MFKKKMPFHVFFIDMKGKKKYEIKQFLHFLQNLLLS